MANAAASSWVVAGCLAKFEVPVKREHLQGRPSQPAAAAAATAEESASAAASAAAAAAAEVTAAAAGAVAATSNGSAHFDSVEGAKIRNAATAGSERSLTIMLTTDDATLFTGTKTVTIKAAKARQLCRAVEKELNSSMPVTLMLDGLVVCEKNGGLALVSDGATLAVKLQPGSNRQKRARAQGGATGVNEIPIGGGEPVSKKSKRQQKIDRRKEQVEIHKSKKHELCSRLALRGECPYGDKCIYTHDVTLFLANKPEDIGPSCPFFGARSTD